MKQSKQQNKGAAASKSKQKVRQPKNVKQNQTGLEKVPVAQSRRLGSIKPNISSSGMSDARIRVKHTEYITDIIGSLAFFADKFEVNPGIAATFPWLSQLAVNYEKYQFRSLEFIYETMTGSSTNGSHIMCADFDATDATPVSKQQALANRCRSRSAPWQEDCMSLDLMDLKGFGPERFVRYGAVPAGTDVKTYDVANFFSCTSGGTNGQPWGELHVRYDVELITPQMEINFPALHSARVLGADSVADFRIYGLDPQVTGSLPVSAVSSTLTFQITGQFLIEWAFSGSTLAVPIVSGSANQRAQLNVILDSTLASLILLYRVEISAIGQTVILDAISSTSVTTCVARICPYQYSLA